MKKIFTTILFLFSAYFAQGQSDFDTLTCIQAPCYIDSSYSFCDSVFNPNFNIIIEPTANNIWQKGKTFKFGTSTQQDTSCAIITDTLNPYPINNTSAFYLSLPKRQSWNLSTIDYYLSFWHKYETDSLFDGCWLEFSKDLGITWQPIDSFQFPNVYKYCNLYHKSTTFPSNFDTLLNGQKAWSGNSNGWVYTSLIFNMEFPVKPQRGWEINAIRFVFQSDSIQKNKAGWMINEINTGYVDVEGGVNDITLKNKLPVFPNPSQTGVFNISYPNNYVKGSLQVYDINGQKLIEKPLSDKIDLSSFTNGLYYYRAFFDNKIYSGVLDKH